MNEITKEDVEQKQNMVTLDAPVESEKKYDKTWGVRLDDDTIKELDALMASEGIAHKKDFLKYLAETARTSALKSRSKGNENLVVVVEESLSTLRRTLNTLIENNLQVEEITRNQFASELEKVEKKKNAVQEKLNEQLDINKELKDEIQKLKAMVVDKDEQIKDLNSAHQDTKELNVNLKRIIEKQDAELEEMVGIENELNELRGEKADLKAELERVNEELNDRNEEVQNKNNMITAMGEDNQRLANAEVALKEEHKEQIAKYMEKHNEEVAGLKGQIKSMEDDLQKQLVLMEREHKVAMDAALLEKDTLIASLQQKVREESLVAQEEVQKKTKEFEKKLADMEKKYAK